jgi:hypothetical protein
MVRSILKYSKPGDWFVLSQVGARVTRGFCEKNAQDVTKLVFSKLIIEILNTRKSSQKEWNICNFTKNNKQLPTRQYSPNLVTLIKGQDHYQ